MSQLLEYVKTDKDSNMNDNSNKENIANNRLETDTEAADLSGSTCNPSERNTVYNGIKSMDQNADLSSTDEVINDFHSEGVGHETETDDNIVKLRGSSSHSKNSSSEESSTRTMSTDYETSSKPISENCVKDNVDNDKAESSNNCQNSKKVKSQENVVLKSDFSEILSGFSAEDLLSMIVKNRHGEDTLFCDTGISLYHIEGQIYVTVQPV